MSPFAAPLGLLALAALPAVLLLHLYRRRHVEHDVSALFLWDEPDAVDAAGAVRQPLRRSASLWLELAAALLAALLLAGWQPFGAAEAGAVVAVLDDSASLSAGAPGDTAAGRAAAALLARASALGRDTRVTLVRSGARPTLLCGPGALLPEAREALAGWRPAAPSHDLRPSLALGRELAGDGELLLLTDRLPEPGAVDAATRVLAFGAPDDNLALLGARREPAGEGEGQEAEGAGEGAGAGDGEHDATRGPGADRVEVVVRSFAASARAATLAVLAGERTLAERELLVEPGASTRLSWLLPAGTPEVTLQLRHGGAGHDALSLDDVARLHPAPRPVVRIGNALEDGVAALLGLPSLPRVLPDVRLVDHAPDLVLAHEPAPPPAWSLLLPREEGELRAYVGPFVREIGHPLLVGTTLAGVVWTASDAFVPAGRPLVSAGDRPLLAELQDERARTLFLDLVPARSTLQRSPDWPILLSNLVAERRQALPGARAVNLTAGERFVATAEARCDWTLSGPDGERTFAAFDRLLLDDLPAGAYELRRAGAPPLAFAVNLSDAAESDLAGAHAGERSPAEAGLLPSRGTHGDTPFALLLTVLLLAAVAADWWVLGRGPGR